jgi:guanylate kinase
MEFARRGVMLVLASPSGAGKSSITRALFEQDPNIGLSVSVTTRARRTDEVNHQHYHFIDVPTFNRMKDEGDLLEWAEVHGNFYGTPRSNVEEELSAGRDVLFDIDYQGTLQLYERCRPDMVTVFILPPSIRELRARLERRAQDSADVIARRLRNAKREMDHYREYDFVVVNEDLELSTQRVRTILASARLARTRYAGLDAFVGELQTQIDALDTEAANPAAATQAAATAPETPLSASPRRARRP